MTIKSEKQSYMYMLTLVWHLSRGSIRMYNFILWRAVTNEKITVCPYPLSVSSPSNFSRKRNLNLFFTFSEPGGFNALLVVNNWV